MLSEVREINDHESEFEEMKQRYFSVGALVFGSSLFGSCNQGKAL